MAYRCFLCATHAEHSFGSPVHHRPPKIGRGGRPGFRCLPKLGPAGFDTIVAQYRQDALNVAAANSVQTDGYVIADGQVEVLTLHPDVSTFVCAFGALVAVVIEAGDEALVPSRIDECAGNLSKFRRWDSVALDLVLGGPFCISLCDIMAILSFSRFFFFVLG